MTFIAEYHYLDMQDVFRYPLGPLSWSLANADGSLKKTNKAVIGHYLEIVSQPCNTPDSNSACIIGAMGLLHSLNGEQKTFEEL